MHVASFGGPYYGVILSQDKITPAALYGKAANRAMLPNDLIAIN
jgi:hypothetical protein